MKTCKYTCSWLRVFDIVLPSIFLHFVYHGTSCDSILPGLTVCSCHATYAVRVNPHSTVVWMSRNSLLKAGAKSEGEVTATGLEPRTT